MIYLDKGYIGCCEMPNKDYGKQQLGEYIKQLRDAGYKKIVAPINGDTWHMYRLVSWSSGEPAFPLEPQNPLWYNDVYEECGFRPLKKYRSDKFSIASVGLLPSTDATLRFRDYRDGDLELIYKISMHGFNDNFLYNDITFEEFGRLYQPVLSMIDNELVVIAEVDNVPAGFIFSFPAGERLILKTTAVLPEFRSQGIGTKMVNHVLLVGKNKGLKTAVAALIADGNSSHNIVAKYGSEKIREYTLYSLEV